jgi:hypothetical protein
MIISSCAETFIKEPKAINEHVNGLFCFALILYLTAFYLLQYMTIRKFKIRGLPYISGIIAILFVFFCSPSPMLYITNAVIFFMLLFAAQYGIGQHQKPHHIHT